MEQNGESSLAMELLQETKKTIKKQWILIIVLIVLLAATNVYHIYQWSQYDTITVDSNDGGNANYIGNDGDVNNYGEDSSAQEKEVEQSEVKRDEN